MSTVTRLLVVSGILALSGCLDVNDSMFSPEKVDAYDWDSADPNLDGELTDPHPSVVPASDRFEDFVTTADGDEIHYVYARRPGATETILYSHGNNKHLGRYWDRVELLWEQGYNVMIYDYPGYGRSTGSPDEEGLYASARAVLAELATLPDVDMDRVWLYGYSIGGVPTYELATTSDVSFRGIITESIFCSVEALVQDGTFVDLPGSYLSSFEMDNCAKIAEVTVPILMMHGRDDAFIVRTHAQMLLDAQPSATLELVPSAEHSDLPLVAGDDYLMWVNDFLSR